MTTHKRRMKLVPRKANAEYSRGELRTRLIFYVTVWVNTMETFKENLLYFQQQPQSVIKKKLTQLTKQMSLYYEKSVRICK